MINVRIAVPVLSSAVFLLAVSSAPVREVPTDQYLIHIFLPWQYPPPEIRKENPSRTAPATIVVFSSSGEYVEHSCYVIDGTDHELYISPGDGHVVAVGTWSQTENTIHVVRKSISRFVRFIGPGPDPLCDPAAITYSIGPTGVRSAKDLYKPAHKLHSPDWDAYVREAKDSSSKCGVG